MKNNQHIKWIGSLILLLFLVDGISGKLLERFCRYSDCNDWYAALMPVLLILQLIIVTVSFIFLIYTVNQLRKRFTKTSLIFGGIGSIPFLYVAIGAAIAVMIR